MSVNVYTEWDPLEEVVVGNCVNINEYNVDNSFKLFFLQNIDHKIIEKSIRLQTEIIKQRQDDLDNFSMLLNDFGIKVLRPRVLEKAKEFSTPNFKEHLCPVDNPRDQSLIIGDEIIETSCQWRRRYFENDLMKDIFKQYFASGSKWTCAPRPEMREENFDFQNMECRGQEHLKDIKNSYDNMEIMFDGAQCLKFGHDIVMNISTYNHQLGFDWLTRHLGDSYRIHPVKITDHHIDGMFMPLKPGVLLINSSTMEGKLNELPKELQKWKVIKVPSAHIEDKAKIQLASENINVNVLPLDTKRVIVFTQDGKPDAQFCDVLDENGFEPITIQLRHSRLFGGGAHCVTLDTVRKGNKERYF